MKQRNCPNCGAPYNVELSTCPYCGTSYFDMSAIDINETSPFYLKLKMDNMVFTSKVIVEPDVQIIFNDVIASELLPFQVDPFVIVTSLILILIVTGSS